MAAVYENTLANCLLLFLVKNVDAGAAKELMAHLVNLQSSLSEVNRYVTSEKRNSSNT